MFTMIWTVLKVVFVLIACRSGSGSLSLRWKPDDGSDSGLISGDTYKFSPPLVINTWGFVNATESARLSLIGE